PSLTQTQAGALAWTGLKAGVNPPLVRESFRVPQFLNLQVRDEKLNHTMQSCVAGEEYYFKRLIPQSKINLMAEKNEFMKFIFSEIKHDEIRLYLKLKSEQLSFEVPAFATRQRRPPLVRESFRVPQFLKSI